MSPPDISESVRVSEPELEHEDSTSDRMITFLNWKKKKKKSKLLSFRICWTAEVKEVAVYQHVAAMNRGDRNPWGMMQTR